MNLQGKKKAHMDIVKILPQFDEDEALWRSYQHLIVFLPLFYELSNVLGVSEQKGHGDSFAMTPKKPGKSRV